MHESERTSTSSTIETLCGGLVVSCQADPGDPLDDTATLCRIAMSVLQGGAAGLRIEGAERVAALRAKTKLPLIGLVKKYDSDGAVYITPNFDSARAVSEAGADMIALDCTLRRLVEAEPWPDLILRIHHELKRPVCADIACLEDGIAAERFGADVVATSLYGYTSETAGADTVSWSLLEQLIATLRVPVIVEGHVTTPEEVRKALNLGAHCVVIGSAITRPRKITARFVSATQG